MLAAAPSKVPYYVAGGVLALYAVLLAAWGISHHEFPGSPGGRRLLMLTSFALAAATMATAVVTAGEEHETEAAAPAATGRTLKLAADPGGALLYDAKEKAVLSGRVVVRFTNDSTVPHNVTIEQGGRDLGATDTVTQGRAKLDLDLAAGKYVYYCSVPGHRQSGMEGTLTVE